MNRTRTFILSVLLVLILAACGGQQAADDGATVDDIPAARERGATDLVFVSSDTWWDGIYLPTYVTKAIVEQELGYNVEIVNGASVPAFFELIETGAADVLMSGWFPTNDFSFDRYPSLVRVGQVYGGAERDAFEGWMATTDFARQHDITGLEDLFDPSIASALDTDGDGLGNIIGCPEAWACSQRNAEILEDYGLGNSYEIDPIQSEEEMLNAIDTRINNGDPAVFYMYTPVAWPEEGAVEDYGVWLTGTEPYLPLAFNRGVTRSDFVATHPDVVHVMNNVRIPGADVGASMRRVLDNGKSQGTLEEIADEWVANNPDLVQSWLPEADFTPAADSTTWPPDVPEDALVVAYSQDKENLFLRLATAYNLNRPADTPPVHPVPVKMDEMLDNVSDGWYAAVSPDSSIWATQIDRQWQQANPDASPLVGSIERYALSPVVIAMLEERADDIGYPDEEIGWADLVDIAQNDPNFRWSHASASTATGLLTLTAEFYAVTDKQSGLTAADVQSEDALARVTEIESTVNRYGAESEDRVIVRNLAAGGRLLDAFVTQEQKVIFFNQNSPDTRLTAIYPEEGTFWMDHPLMLLEGDWVTDEQRRVFRDFAEFVGEPEQQQIVLELGYRPGDVSVPLDGPDSLLTAENNVNPDAPETLLQVPSPGTLEAIREAWLQTKRPASIVLVVDVSGSMEGDKLAGAKGALFSFVDQIESERDHVALIAFSDNAQMVQSLAPLNQDAMSSSIRGLQAGGGTQLYDAISVALGHLEQNAEPGRARVIVAMTDGQSEGELATVEESLEKMEDPAIIYTVSYGEDADMDVLQRIAQLGEGQVYPSDPETIGQLYELLSEYF